jgi:predicted DNA-binding transcriptional regulator YafY
MFPFDRNPKRNVLMPYRGNLTYRLVELQLLLAERPRSQHELVQHFRVNRKTIRKDIDALSGHHPITEERAGRHVMYRFIDGFRFQPPQFTPSELATLLLAQEAIAITEPNTVTSPFAIHARTLMGKVRAALPEYARQQLDVLAHIFGSAATPVKDFTSYAATIELLTTAALEQQRVLMRYYTLAQDRTSERQFDPYAVYFDPDGATFKVLGYDHRRCQIIPFAIDHIRSIQLTDESFTRPPDFDLHKFLEENCFNGIHGKPVTVRLRAYGVTARVFAERQFHPSQRLIESTPATKEHAETTTIEMRVASGRGLVRFILSWVPDIDVLSPTELRCEVVAALQTASTMHAADEKNRVVD